MADLGLTFGLKSNKVPEIVMCALSLWNFIVRLRLHSMDDVGKFDGVLNEEHGYVVADDIPIPLSGIEFDGKSANITYGVLTETRRLTSNAMGSSRAQTYRTTAAALYSAEANEGRSQAR